MYMCQPTVPLSKETLLYLLHLIKLKKNAFCKAKASGKGNNKIKLLKTIQVLTGW